MKTWSAFLESIASRGGNLLVMVMFVGGMLGLLVIFLYHPANQASDRVITVVLATFSGFSGALLNALVGAATHSGSQNGTNGKAPPTTLGG